MARLRRLLVVLAVAALLLVATATTALASLTATAADRARPTLQARAKRGPSFGRCAASQASTRHHVLLRTANRGPVRGLALWSVCKNRSAVTESMVLLDPSVRTPRADQHSCWLLRTVRGEVIG